MAQEIITLEDLQKFRLQFLEDLRELLQQPNHSQKQWLRSSEVRKNDLSGFYFFRFCSSSPERTNIEPIYSKSQKVQWAKINLKQEGLYDFWKAFPPKSICIFMDYKMKSTGGLLAAMYLEIFIGLSNKNQNTLKLILKKKI